MEKTIDNYQNIMNIWTKAKLISSDAMNDSRHPIHRIMMFEQVDQ